MATDMEDYQRIWQLQDAITTVVDANGFTVWSLRHSDGGFQLELTEHIQEDRAAELCGQFPLDAEYSGEGRTGTLILLWL